jgi:hypothetical protein
MGRKVEPRNGDYDADAVVVLRIAKAVEGDGTVSQKWRTIVSTKLREAMRLLNSPERVSATPKKASNG